MSSQRGVTDDRREQIAREKTAVIPQDGEVESRDPSIRGENDTNIEFALSAKGIVNRSGVHSDHIARRPLSRRCWGTSGHQMRRYRAS
jgi:hypothetical protein